MLIKNINNADDIVKCIKRRQNIRNIQRVAMDLPKIHFFVKKIPDEDLRCYNNTQYFLTVRGILSYFNFNSIDIEPNFQLNTRIYSDNENFSHNLVGKISQKPFATKKEAKNFESEKIENVNSIRRKRLFIKMKERIANLTLTADQGLYYKKECPDLNSIPDYCDLKETCSNCEKKCTYTAEEIKIIPMHDLKQELKLHHHQQTRTNELTKEKHNIEEVRYELISHYRFVHKNFGENDLEKIFCICQEREEEKENDDSIITWTMCSFAECEYQWFHLSCMREMHYPLPIDLYDESNF